PITAILCLLSARMAAPCQSSGSYATNREQCNSQVVDDGSYGLPNRESSDALGIERHDDRVPRMNLRRLRAPEPARPLPGNDVPVCPYHVDSLPIGFLSGAAAPGDVIVPRQARLEHMGSRTLYFAQDRDLLSLLWDQQLVAVPDYHVVGHTGGPLDNPADIDHQATDRLGIAKLAHQLLPHLQTLNRTAGAGARIGGTTADDSFER